MCITIFLILERAQHLNSILLLDEFMTFSKVEIVMLI